MSRLINVARWIPRSRANGPGERFVLWVQGCGLACDGCWNPDTWPFAPRRLCPAEELLTEIERADGIEGITISGGEPFAQAESLIPLVEAVRARGLSVLVFSGFALKELRSPAARRLLALIDLLVSGRFVAALATRDLPLLGSSNQTVHFLSSRYAPADLAAVAACEAHVCADGSVRWTGFPTEFLGESGADAASVKGPSNAISVPAAIRHPLPMHTTRHRAATAGSGAPLTASRVDSHRA